MIKEKINKAYEFSKKAHEGQIRKYSDLAYFVHPKYVARILEDLTNDEDLIIAGFLHDCIEDTNITFDNILFEFGCDIAEIVNWVTLKKGNKIDQIKNILINSNYAAVIVKLADRYHNLQYIDKDIKSKQHLKFIKKYYKETRSIFIEEVVGRKEYGKYNESIELLKSMILNKLEYLKIKFNLN